MSCNLGVFCWGVSVWFCLEVQITVDCTMGMICWLLTTGKIADSIQLTILCFFLQVGFFDIVALPLFQSFAQAFIESTPMLDAVKDNYQMWREEATLYSQSSSSGK